MKNITNTLKEWKKEKTLAVIFPHPDDETMATGGLLLAAKKLGWKTVVITLTQGGAGKVHINGKGRSTKEIRSQELDNAIKVLGVDQLILGNFTDGELREEEKSWKLWVRKQINLVKPGIVVTYDPSGLTGHPDHIVLSLGLKKIVSGLKFRPDLWWVSSIKPAYKLFGHPDSLKYLTVPTYVLPLSFSFVFKKLFAAREHKSQGFRAKLGFLVFLFLVKYPYEWYHKVNLSKDYSYEYVKFDI